MRAIPPFPDIPVHVLSDQERTKLEERMRVRLLLDGPSGVVQALHVIAAIKSWNHFLEQNESATRD